MENASKALIIAGAILISIVLVTVGVLVVNSLNPEEALSQMSQQEIQNFNQKFDTLAGNNVMGTNVKTIISNVITSNATNEEARHIQITATARGSITTAVNASTDSGVLSTLRNQINTQHRYNITITYNADGLVDVITIVDNATT